MTEAEQELESVLLQIKHYAREYNLSAEQVRDLFHAGLAAANALADHIPGEHWEAIFFHADSLPSAGENKVA